jgi:hypothetical protein
VAFTEEQDAILRACYAKNKYGNNAHRKAVEQLGLAGSIVLRRAVQLGLTHTRERFRWTDEELEIVEKNAHQAIETIQRKLAAASPIKRTRAAIVGAIHEGRFRTNLEGLNHSQLSEALGLAVDTLHKYRMAGLIKAAGRLPSLDCHKYRGRRLHSRPEVCLQAPQFIYAHPGLIDLGRVAKLWFIDLLRDGRRGQAGIDKSMHPTDRKNRGDSEVYPVAGVYPRFG